MASMSCALPKPEVGCILGASPVEKWMRPDASRSARDVSSSASAIIFLASATSSSEPDVRWLTWPFVRWGPPRGHQRPASVRWSPPLGRRRRLGGRSVLTAPMSAATVCPLAARFRRSGPSRVRRLPPRVAPRAPSVPLIHMRASRLEVSGRRLRSRGPQMRSRVS